MSYDPKPSHLLALLAAVMALAAAPSARAQSCTSADPSQWPAPARPYFMVVVDNSRSMGTAVATGTNSCGYQHNRLGDARCAVQRAIQAMSGEASFGLATYASARLSCPSNAGTCASCNETTGCFTNSGCSAQQPTGSDYNCGPIVTEPNITASLNVTNNTAGGGLNLAGTQQIHAGGFVAVPLVQDDYWSSPQNPNNFSSLWNMVDNDCGNGELGAFGNAPLGGTLFSLNQYFTGTYSDPFTGAAVSSPIGSAPNERACRSINVILITDGDETCDSYDLGNYPNKEGLAVFQAGRLRSPGVTVGGQTFQVKTHVIGFSAASTTGLDHIASAGGTASSYFVSDEAQLTTALLNIVHGSMPAETCNNADDDCNGCVDEGFVHYCNDQYLGACCSWKTPAQRTACGAFACNCCNWTRDAGNGDPERRACIDSYLASITQSNPTGDRSLLPCVTPAEATSAARWLCYDPGDVCDERDNNCVGGTDEGASKCGNPAHCPQPEMCNARDDDCDGAADEDNVCATCAGPASGEVCDGCDNDCDGMTDNGLSVSLPCGHSGPGIPAYCAGTITCKPPQMVSPGMCAPGGGFTACTFPMTPLAETCNALDDDCNGVIDDDITGAPCVPAGIPSGLVYNDAGHPNTVCRRGVTQCVNGATACVGFVGPTGAELCDGLDNDCDGSVDESPAGVGQSCGNSLAPCTAGVTACVNGALQCVGGIRPTDEICDGIDNDCDGVIDDGALADAPPAGMRGCWELPGNCCSFPVVNPTASWCPPPGATCEGKGDLTQPCSPGTLRCAGSSGWVCQGSRPPAPEVCDGRDNDCSGVIDDGALPQVGAECGSSVGECSAGALACENGVLTCAGSAPPTPELCDGLDNDCDGEIDEDLATVGTPCTPLYDTVAYPGDRTAFPCQPGVLQCSGEQGLVCVGGAGPTPEICDGLDNDCDGQVDETGTAPDGLDGSEDPNPPSEARIGDACGASLGTCEQGAYECVLGAVACMGGRAASAESCDCEDNDCDGESDNQQDGAAPMCGTGRACVKLASGCACALPCTPGDSESCPSGQSCVEVVSSASGAPAGGHCVAVVAAAAPEGEVASAEGNPQGGCAGAPLPFPSLLLLLSFGLIRRVRASGAAHRRGRGSARASITVCLGVLGIVLGGCGEASSPPPDGADFDPSSPRSCGSLDNDCFALANSNWDRATITCEPGASGAARGCRGTCATDYYDRDQDGLCESLCLETATDDTTCDGRDDDCNGLVDDGVDLCSDDANCGACGRSCDVPHALAQCVAEGAGLCDELDTRCEIVSCVCDGPGQCFWDRNGSAADGCEYRCDLSDGGAGLGVEACGDGIDNDCDGLIDAADDVSGDARIGVTCFGGAQGLCADAAHAGATSCDGFAIRCAGANVLVPGERVETCNGVDDDCDGIVDNELTDVGGPCGSEVGACAKGSYGCDNGIPVCVGAIEPAPEVCDGIDNDCDGHADNNLPVAEDGAPCNVPVPPPASATSSCKAGVTACLDGNVVCADSTGPTSTHDSCGIDANCDGVLTEQPDLSSDVHNCGQCGKDCLADALHADWVCVGNACIFNGCQPGWFDLDGDQECEYACTFVSAQEICNDRDDNCDGEIDEEAALVAPALAQVCGVSPAASAPECALYDSSTNPGGVSLACSEGSWQCTFHTAEVCSPSCAFAAEVCDGVDNDCDGLLNENVPRFGEPCASDMGLPPPGHGACRTVGSFVCETASTTVCNAVKDLSRAGEELCDGVDNDCDGLVDEPYSNPGPDAARFVKPAVTKFASSSWIMSYEASRNNATAVSPGSGNGYTCVGGYCPSGVPPAPAGVTLDGTRACSMQGKLPWFNVTEIEAEQACAAIGGHLCTTAEWRAACVTSPPGTTTCEYGYAPNGSACSTPLGPPYAVPFPTSGSKYCNLGPTYDFDAVTTGDQDGQLAAGSPLLKNCYADWKSLLGNGTTNGAIFDMTGNLRELTNGTFGVSAGMGGSFLTQDESGATCDFEAYAVDMDFAARDLGFRCCFSQDPRL